MTELFISESCRDDICDDCREDGCWCECHEEDDDGV
jgi:hypothetical protein